MNALIEQFANAADDYADNKSQMPGEFHGPWHDIRDTKFAQLVAGRCIIAALNVDDIILAVELADLFGVES